MTAKSYTYMDASGEINFLDACDVHMRIFILICLNAGCNNNKINNANQIHEKII